jgi:hypothetical protein
VIYELPNPFMRLSVSASPGADREAAALEPDEPPFRGGAAAEPVGFVLDEEAFALEIEPVPAFLARDDRAEEIEELLKIARAEEWPAPPRRMVG